MLAYRHSGFSVDTSVCIAAYDRAGLERLLRYCARPAFALDRLRKAGSVLVYRSAKQHSEPVSKPHNKRGAKVDEITLTPPELIERIAALVPPPRTHRHRYFGVLAANSPHRAAVVSLAQGAVVQWCSGATGAGAGRASQLGRRRTWGRQRTPTQAVPAQPVQPKRLAHYLWAVLIARIYEVLPLLCPLCGGQMRIIAFITHSADSATYWSTSGWIQSRRASNQHADRRCGTQAMRRAVRAWSQCQTGTKQLNWYRTLRWISASVGKG